MSKLIALFLLPLAALAGNPEPAIVPAVQQWHGGEGSISIAGTNAITFALTDKPFHAGTNVIEEQSYTVDVTTNRVTVTSHNRAGAFYGSQTVLQMLATGSPLPCGRIVDGPITRYRMLMLDVGRKAFPINTLYDYLRILGWYKMNVLHLHLSDSSFDNHYGGFRVQCDTFPGLTSKDCFYTKRQLREFQDVAAAMGIMVLPEIDMPGHAAPFTLYWPELAWRNNPYAGNLDVNNPKTVERMKALLDEMIPIFDSPYIHIGTDEYRVPHKDAEERARTGNAFRTFINTMNAHIRSKGKQCVVWDGWEHVKSNIPIDPSVVVDMWWGCFDTNEYIKRGHKVFNSNQNVTYLTTGRPTYGVNNAAIYNNWRPNQFGRVNPPLGDPGILGAKLNVWCGQGPSGWTMTEIADQVLPSVVSYSEKMWGRKGSPNYQAFLERAKVVEHIPGITVFNRLTGENGFVIDQPEEVALTKENVSKPLPFEKAERGDLEFPWTLTMEVKKAAINGRGIILSSDRAEICDYYKWDERKKVTTPEMKEKISKITRAGFGVVRAAGNWGATPAEAKMAAENSRVYGDPLPMDKWVKVAVVATRKHTEVYFDGKRLGQQNQQMICPLRRYGSTDAGNSFVGSIKHLRVYDRALTVEEINRRQ